MIELVQFINSYNGSVITLNDDIYPMDKFESPVDIRTEDKEKMQDHGQWPTYTYLGKRLIRCEGDLFGEDSGDYIAKRRALIRALMPQRGSRVTGILTLRFTELPEDVTAECNIDGYPEMPIEALSPTRTRYQVTFKCFDPILYGTTLNTESSEFSAATLGRTYPKTYPKIYAAFPGLAGQITITNPGDIEVLPIVSLIGPCTSPQLQFFADGTTYSLTFEGLTLSGTDILTVDFKLRTAVSVELGDVYSYVAGTWWALRPGGNLVRYFAYSASSPSRADFSWHNGYMI